MPKGPQGRKFPGDVIGMSFPVATNAPGEIMDIVDRGRVKPCETHVAASAEKLISHERSDITRGTADARWG